MNRKRELVLGNRLDELPKLHQALEEFFQGLNVTATARNAVELALEEHLTNIISYAYDDPAEHQIIVRLRLTKERLQIEIEDDGRPFNPLDVPPVDISVPLDQKPIGGLGVHLIRKLMDSVAYDRHDGKNILRLGKALS